MIRASNTLTGVRTSMAAMHSCVRCIHLTQEPFLSLFLAFSALLSKIVVGNFPPCVIVVLKVLSRVITTSTWG